MRTGEIVAARFELQRLAGTGGMGEVWRAHDRRGDRTVALKILAAGTAHGTRFEREAQVLSELRHPGIVRYLGHGETEGGGRYLAMEWLEGEDLSTRLRRASLTTAESVAVASRVAEALTAAHRRGIVHRDVKPGNIFLVDGQIDRVKLLDFGIMLSRLTDRAITRTGALIGTPGYMAPEQARASRDLDARCDVYALGCVLFKCLTGRTPFTGADQLAVLMKTVLEEAPRVSSLRAVPPALDDLVATMLAQSPGRRPRDAAAVVDGLAKVDLARTQGSPSDAPSTPSQLRATSTGTALTSSERVIRCLVVARSPHVLRSDDATAIPGTAATLEHDLRERLRALGGELQVLAGDALLVTVGNAGAATDQAVRAARCALAMRALVPGMPVAIVARPGDTGTGEGMGEVLDRAARILDGARDRDADVRLDDVAGGLLDGRFDVTIDVNDPKQGRLLRGERDVADGARMFLGKPHPCVGRERELSLLAGTYYECVAEPIARVALVTAPAGVGKSRLRHELLRILREQPRPPQVWIGRGDPLTAGSPFGMIAPALRREIGIRDGEPLAARQHKLRARIERTVSPRDVERVFGFLAEIVGAPLAGEVSLQLEAARLDPIMMGDQMRRAFIDFVAAECAQGPLLVVLEDLHWGDLPTVKLVDATLRELRDDPLMILAMARPEVHEVFPQVFRERGVQELNLEPLKRRSSEKLVRQVLGDAVDDETVVRVVERAEGNAFYLEELIRAVAEGKGAALPDTVIAMVQGRIEELPPESRRLLRAASIFGSVFWHSGLMALIGADDRTIDDAWMNELVEREVITARNESRFPGEREFVFRHALVREAAYAMLTDDDRRLGHELAAQWLASVGESDAMVLAEHFDRGGQPQRAIELYLRATEDALEGNDLEAAIRRADRAIQHGAEGEVKGRLKLLQAEANRWLGRNAEMKQLAREVLAMVPRGSPTWWGAVELVGVVTARLGDNDELVALADEIDAIEVPDDPAAMQRVNAETTIARALLTAGLRERGEAMWADVKVRSAPFRDDPRVMSRVDGLGSMRAKFLGDEALGLRLGQRALDAYEKVGNQRSACMFRCNIGYAWCNLGFYEEAERMLRSAVSMSEKLGLHGLRAGTQNNLGYALARLGRADEGIQVLETALAALTEQEDHRLAGGARIHLALVLLSLGDIERAEREARTAAEGLQRFLPLAVKALATLASVLVAAGRAEEALATATDAVRLLASLDGTEEGESLARLVHAEALHAVGDHAGARAAIVDARDRLRARAAKLTEREVSESFLQRVPENARTLALAEAWT